MATKDIWVRRFKRDSGDDEDSIATDEFKKENFTDYYGQFLQQETNSTISTFDQLVTIFWNQTDVKLDTYAIADGAFVDQKNVAGDWFQPHLRFISVVTPKSASALWRLYIVGPGQVKSTEGFLQVASWDGSVFRFYAIETLTIPGNPRAWVYQGNSFDAFTDNSAYDTAYLGPFNGHVNGALIMKERTTLPVLSGASVRDAHNFQDIVEDSIRNWYGTRLSADFVDPKTQGPKASPDNVQRWMAHLLLTTTVNFATSTFNGTTYTADMNLFFNSELLLSGTDFGIMPDLTSFDFTFDYGMYKLARNRLRLCLLQEVRKDSPVPPPGVPSVSLVKGTLGGGKETASADITEFVEVLPNNEGVPFVTLQTAFEDAQGVAKLYSLGGLGDGFPQCLVSDKAIRTILMLDFWNPVYSWRRGVLMDYVPSQTAFVDGTYDLEKKWIAAIGASSYATQEDSPECQFLALYNGDDDVSKYQTRITNYLTAVCAKLSDPDGLYEYLCLAEAKRRIYRPLPLDEFGVQLPYALNLPVDWAKIEMQEDGTTTPIPPRGMDFFQLWIDSLAGFDPKVIPASKSTKSKVAMSGARASKCPTMRQRKPKRDQCPVSSLVGKYPNS
ncbi:histidine acid phosphatase [Pyrenophora seminiperda CCB06]|uniref:Histidine acid phosphatase n=1 Tax=Pyrenophora seminiperda CCB06 TaxID=1302712 RepID=A0A3M7M1Q8_9PLEO|nr:histidine acid phosphatase [Pyrenophora seminiperda CCB06]